MDNKSQNELIIMTKYYRIVKIGKRWGLHHIRWCKKSGCFAGDGFDKKTYRTKKELIRDNLALIKQSKLYDWSKNGWFAL